MSGQVTCFTMISHNNTRTWKNMAVSTSTNIAFLLLLISATFILPLEGANQIQGGAGSSSLLASSTVRSTAKLDSHKYESFRKDDRALQEEFLDFCQAYNINLLSEGYEGFCDEPCIVSESSSNSDGLNTTTSIVSSKSCSEGCDTCAGISDECALWNNFDVLHEEDGDYFDFVCKTYTTEGSPYFGYEYCIDFSEVGDFNVCQATLNGEACLTCESRRLCTLNQTPYTGRFVDCSNVDSGHILDECAGIFEGVFKFELALGDAFFIFPRCPSLLLNTSDAGYSQPPAPAPVVTLPPVSVPEGSQDFLDSCMRRLDLVSLYGGILGKSCGPCEYSSLLQGYTLSCPQSCDECYSGECLRLNNITSVFNENAVGNPSGFTDSFCKQVATPNSDFYGMEYCIDLDDILEGAFCKSTLNGLPCQTCFVQTCANGNDGRNIDCNNVIPGTYFDGCSGEAGGVYQVEQRVLTLAQSGITFEPRCPSLLDEIPPSNEDSPSTFVPPSPWQCAPSTDGSGMMSCFNTENQTFPLDPTWPIRVLYNCPAAITDNPTLDNCDPECLIVTLDEEGNLDRTCLSCTLLESGDIAYGCTNALPDVECSARDEDLNCLLWDCTDLSVFLELDENNLEYKYSCRRVAHEGYPLPLTVPADSHFRCKEPLLFSDVPDQDKCRDICAIREVNASVPEADSRYCDMCFVLPDGEIAYDCANVFPNIDCPVKGSNGACLKESQPFAFCPQRRSDGSWNCFDSESPSISTDTLTAFACDKRNTLFINLDECQSECYIVLTEADPDTLLEIDGVTCTSCTLLPNGKIAYDCRNVLLDSDCPARDDNGICYSTLSPTPAPFSDQQSSPSSSVSFGPMMTALLLQSLLSVTLATLIGGVNN